MEYAKLLIKNKAAAPKVFEAAYSKAIEEKIAAKYSIQQEIAILRQRDTKPQEFEEYNAFVEQCKAEVKQDLDLK